MENKKNEIDPKKLNGFQKFILSLQDNVEIKGYKIPKKYIFALGGAIAVYLFFLIGGVLMTPNNAKTREETEKAYQELLRKKKEKLGMTEFKERTPEQMEKENYENSIKEILNMSDEEIRNLLKTQGMNPTDAEIAEFRREVAKNIPQSAETLKNTVDQFKNGQGNAQVPNGTQVPNNNQEQNVEKNSNSVNKGN